MNWQLPIKYVLMLKILHWTEGKFVLSKGTFSLFYIGVYKTYGKNGPFLFKEKLLTDI